MRSDQDKEWEDWKKEQVEAVPRHARKRMRKLLDDVPRPTRWNNGIKKLSEVGKELRKILKKRRVRR